MHPLHQIRKAANRVLSPLGLAIERVEKQPWFRPNIVSVQVGRFTIQIPTINPLAKVYVRNPEYTGHLGRLAALLKAKYPDCAAIDIGANVGDTACIIKSAADVPVLCIEGDDFAFGFLEQNLPQLKNATAHKLFLGEKTETMAVNLDKAGWNTTLLPDETGAAGGVKIVSLDDFLAGQPQVERYKLVKIDTEGFDCRILRGARQFIGQVRPVITFEYNRDNMAALGENGLDTLAVLAGLGYTQAAVHDNEGRFFCSTSLADQATIRNLHDYADGKNAAVYYFDLTLFHGQDGDIAHAFAKGEQSHRVKGRAAKDVLTTGEN